MEALPFNGRAILFNGRILLYVRSTLFVNALLLMNLVSKELVDLVETTKNGGEICFLIGFLFLMELGCFRRNQVFSKKVH